MSAAHGHIQIPPRDQVIARDLGGPAKIALVLGLAGLGVAIGIGMTLGDHMHHMGHSLLIGIAFSLTITLGALFFTLLHHVTCAGWSVVVRRVAEAMTAALPVLFILVLAVIGIPVLMGNSFIYDWADDAFRESRELINLKSGYFSGPFFVARLFIYFAIWVGIARYYSKHSAAQDDDQNPERSLWMQRRSGPAIVAFGLATTFAAFDYLMSLNAEWFSTMYGVYIFAGCFWSFLATLGLATMWLEKRGQLKNVVTVEHYHDIGKLLFAFTVFWSYVSFSQFMLYWYADIPEETHWFHYRMWGEWNGVATVLVAGHFAIPLLGLMSRHVKRNRKVFAFWCIYCLVFHIVDLFWNVMPELANGIVGGNPAEVGPPLGPMEILVTLGAIVGVAGLCAFAFFKRLDGKPALAIGDPRLSESLAFQNV